MQSHTHLLVIDAQNDFCDLPDAWLPPDPLAGSVPIRPALPVAGAHADLLRLAAFIERAGRALTDLTLTFDSHHRVGIERPAFWRQGSGAPVEPFTPIAADDVRAGRFAPRDAACLPRVLAYLDALQAARRYTLMAWPAHCEIGSWGHNLHPAIARACAGWESRALRPARKIMKGANPWTEHYSAVQAEVPDPADPATQPNTELLDALAQADLLLVAGQAGSHCVKATVEDVVDHLVQRKGEACLSGIVLLTDCMSPVHGFDTHQQAFLHDMRQRGVRLASSVEMLAAVTQAAPR